MLIKILSVSRNIYYYPVKNFLRCIADYESNPENSGKSIQQKTQEIEQLLHARESSSDTTLPIGIYYRVYDLISEEVILNVNSGYHDLPNEGFYRVELRYGYVENGIHYSFDINERPGYFNIEDTEYYVDHCQNYYDFSLNYYDKAGRLLKSTQPNGKDFKSEFTYNSLGQLLSTTNIDEGTARFAYRKDGQIRFSQNIKQQLKEEFSYTNYDRLGRPIESGVYRGGDIFLPNIILAPDGTTPFDLQQNPISGPITPIHQQNIEEINNFGLYEGGSGYLNNASEESSWESSLASNESIGSEGFLRFGSNFTASLIPAIPDDGDSGSGNNDGDNDGGLISNPNDTILVNDEISGNLRTDGSRTTTNGKVVTFGRIQEFYSVIVGLVESNRDDDFVINDDFPIAFGINLVAKINISNGSVSYHTYIMEGGHFLTYDILDSSGNVVDTANQDFGAFDPNGGYSIHRTASTIEYRLNNTVFHSTTISNTQAMVAKALFKQKDAGVKYILLDEIVDTPPTNPFEGIVDNADGLNDNNCYEQHFTEYDIPDIELQEKLAECGLSQRAYRQTFLSGNVSKTYTLRPQTNNTWYSYDVYGRVKWLIQQPEGLGCLKTIDYDYDPITGQVIKVDYQRQSKTERFVHQYTYNDAGQLVTVATSTDGFNFTQQARYKYNETGALVRTELAENLQGIDYVYNLNGQLKAINHPSLTAANDPGNDGANGFVADVFGMSIQYYQGDYTRTTTPTPLASITTSTPNQFNGNIQAIQWQNQNGGASTYNYAYNKNNWLEAAQFNSATTTNGDYNVENLSYDANGNIKTLLRNGVTNQSGNNAMDDFTYHYKNDTNQLTTVEDSNDNVDPNRFDDLKNQAEIETVEGPLGTTNTYISNQNYTYNSIGQLVINAQEGIGYEYNASGLVTKIKAFTQSDTNNYLTLLEEDYEEVTCNNGRNTAQVWFGNLDRNATQRGRMSFSDQADQEEDYVDEECMNIMFSLLDANPNDLVALPNYCSSFDSDNDSQYNNRHQINFYDYASDNTYSTSTRFTVVPNAYHKLNLDILLLQEQTQRIETTTDPSVWETQTTPIDITYALVEVLEYGANGDEIVLASTEITPQNENQVICNRALSHVSLNFTPAKQKLTLRITVVNNGITPNVLPERSYSNIFQTIEIDNIALQVANEDKLAFYYDDRGHRIRKEAFVSGLPYSDITHYIRDASGSVMAIYNKPAGRPSFDTSIPREHPIYGASRLGIHYKDGSKYGTTAYQLTDHLGNVRAVVMKNGDNALSLTSKTDYYPFGMPMPNRNVEGGYRYKFQGQEKDSETGMEAFQLRLWDSRIGRWLSPDPAHEFYSPYLGIGNDPVNFIDRRGDTIRRGNGITQREFDKLTSRLQQKFPTAYKILQDAPQDVYIHFKNVPLKDFGDGRLLQGETNISYSPKGDVSVSRLSYGRMNKKVYIDIPNSDFYVSRGGSMKLSTNRFSLPEPNLKKRLGVDVSINKIDITVNKKAGFGNLGDEFGHAIHALNNPVEYYVWNVIETFLNNSSWHKSEFKEGAGHYFNNPSGSSANYMEADFYKIYPRGSTEDFLNDTN